MNRSYLIQHIHSQHDLSRLFIMFSILVNSVLSFFFVIKYFNIDEKIEVNRVNQ